MCIDYRHLNKVTIKNKYSNHGIDDLLDQIQGAYHFLKIDHRLGYQQQRVIDCENPKTAFRTQLGHYGFIVIAFGIRNSTTSLMDFVNKVFRQYLELFIIIFIHDVRIYYRIEEKHWSHLRVVLQTLKNSQLLAKFRKSVLVESIAFRGHIVSSELI